MFDFFMYFRVIVKLTITITFQMKNLIFCALLSFTTLNQQFVYSQNILDDFELGAGISNWVGDNCQLDTNFSNPVSLGINTSAKVMKYHDLGGQYANVRFDIGRNLDLSINHTFSLKIFVPSSGITGAQNNQVSLKLQDGSSATPWSNQTEIIKNISLNQWQIINFNFVTDAFINMDASSPAPILRTDLSRIVIQVNGENNTDQVLAYIDDFEYYDTVSVSNFSQLVWSDEFNGNGAISNVKWFHQTQLPWGGSWFNGELQHYTNRMVNSSMDGGNLNLIAKRENFTDQGQTKQFTSARLNSKFAFKYGRVEVRAKLPTGVGTWPAIWMLGKNISESGAYWQTQGYGTTGWPACGEIDIIEHWGANQNFVQSAMHTPSSFGATVNHGGQTISTASTDFHVYALEWTSEKMVFSVDSVVHYVYDPNVKNASTWPFDAEQYLLLNIAIEPRITSGFSQDTMIIDYVRIYQEPRVSISEFKTSSPVFFPNPVNDELNIETTFSGKEIVLLNLFSIDGKLIKSYEQNIQQNKIKINGMNTLPKGLYFLNYKIENKNYTIKFVKS